LPKFFSVVYNSPVKNDLDLSEIGSVSQEIYLSAIDLAHVLKVTDAEIAKLARSAVLIRVSHPQDSRAFLYPLLENVTRYVTHLRSAREKAYLGYIREKSRLQRVQRVRAELKHALEAGEMVDKEWILSKLAASILAFKQALLSRGERLEATLSQIPDRESRVKAIRGDDVQLLALLADSLKAANIEADGQET
jgi:phage terminase Nu1 subunit (DNA packaging protein)